MQKLSEDRSKRMDEVSQISKESHIEMLKLIDQRNVDLKRYETYCFYNLYSIIRIYITKIKSYSDELEDKRRKNDELVRKLDEERLNVSR